MIFETHLWGIIKMKGLGHFIITELNHNCKCFCQHTQNISKGNNTSGFVFWNSLNRPGNVSGLFRNYFVAESCKVLRKSGKKTPLTKM